MDQCLFDQIQVFTLNLFCLYFLLQCFTHVFFHLNTFLCVFKAYEHASKEHLGILEKIGDLKVDDPRVINEAQRRYQSYGMSFDEEEWKDFPVITPVQMMKSTHLIKVLDQRKIDELRDCVLNKK